MKKGYDQLTGLLDRISCTNYLSRRLKNCENLSVVLIDLDNFINIDSKIGASEGDRVLLKISKYLSDNIGEGILGRYGGDEFIIIYKNYDKDNVHNITNKLHKEFKKQRFVSFDSPYGKLPITASIGIAFSSLNANGSFLILKLAETALAMAKKKGRNRIEFADDFKIHVFKNHARVSTAAGGGLKGYTGDGNAAFKAQICEPYGVDVLTNGELLIVERGNHIIRRVDKQGALRTVAGTGISGYSGDNGPAVHAMLCKPSGVAVGSGNCFYIADTGNHCIRRVSPDGIITTYAGYGKDGWEGDGGKAVSAALSRPGGVVVDEKGCVYTNDYGNNVIRMITPEGIIRTVAGSGEYGYGGDGKKAVNASMDRPYGIAANFEGSRLYIADYGNHCIREVDMDSGIITTLCGTGEAGYSGDGGNCSMARLDGPFWACTWGRKHLLVADANNNCIRIINLDSKRIDTLTGGKEAGYRDTDDIREARFNTPAGLTAKYDKGILYIADYSNNAIRRIDLKNIIL